MPTDQKPEPDDSARTLLLGAARMAATLLDHDDEAQTWHWVPGHRIALAPHLERLRQGSRLLLDCAPGRLVWGTITNKHLVIEVRESSAGNHCLALEALTLSLANGTERSGRHNEVTGAWSISLQDLPTDQLQDAAIVALLSSEQDAPWFQLDFGLAAATRQTIEFVNGAGTLPDANPGHNKALLGTARLQRDGDRWFIRLDERSSPALRQAIDGGEAWSLRLEFRLPGEDPIDCGSFPIKKHPALPAQGDRGDYVYLAQGRLPDAVIQAQGLPEFSTYTVLSQSTEGPADSPSDT